MQGRKTRLKLGALGTHTQVYSGRWPLFNSSVGEKVSNNLSHFCSDLLSKLTRMASLGNQENWEKGYTGEHLLYPETVTLFMWIHWIQKTWAEKPEQKHYPNVYRW